MSPSFRIAALAAFLLALAVALGAFGAHGLEGRLSELALKTYATGNTYHALHALALLGLGLAPIKRTRAVTIGCLLLFLGICFFSGFCYAYALSGQRLFAMLVPIGGLGFIVGWLTLAYAFWQHPSEVPCS
jgi:uncharacterized membrane protein YgdD (TMEM256/DUF423 family)